MPRLFRRKMRNLTEPTLTECLIWPTLLQVARWGNLKVLSSKNLMLVGSRNEIGTQVTITQKT